VREARGSEPDDEEGWWLASDGRWYPPESFPGRHPKAASRRSAFRTAWTVVFVVLVMVSSAVVVGGVAYVRHYDGQVKKVRAASKALTPPAHWTDLGRFEDSDSGPFCVISCPRMTVTIVYRDGATSGEACDTIRAQIERDIGPTRPDAGTFCGWRARIPGAGSGASVWAGTLSAEELRRSQPTTFPWLPPISASDDATYVAVYVSAGPT
jgi:hypothetical protein